MDSTITVGITGGIGTGKSFICRILNIMGYPVFYADTEARKILESDPEAKKSVISIFGDQAYHDHTLNAPHIASQVFKNQTLLDQLNKITHPLVRRNFEKWCSIQKNKIVFHEAAILFETGSYKNFNYTVLITAPEELRIERIQKRDNVQTEKIRDRMKAQWSDAEKIPLASFIINNDESTPLLPQIEELLKFLNT